MTYKQETIKPYSQEGEKGKQVEQMFDNIAHSYDLLNHALSLGIDKHWRKAAIASLRPYAPQRILDVATGTGDFALLAAKMLRPESLVGADLSEGMLKVAREKALRSEYARALTFQKEDCMDLSFAEGSFDAGTVAYGVRNFQDLDRGLREMHRILRPGGRLVIIELTTPQQFPMKQLFRFYSRVWMPFVGKLVSKESRVPRCEIQALHFWPQHTLYGGKVVLSSWHSIESIFSIAPREY